MTISSNIEVNQKEQINNIATREEGNPDKEQLPEIRVVNVDAAMLEVPEDERAENIDPEADDLAQVRAQGYFSPTRGMANIQGHLDGKLYAKIYVNRDGKRFIQYVEKYSDGSYSPCMSIAQSDMVIAGKH